MRSTMKDKKVDADDDDNEDSIDYFGSDMDEEDSEAPGLMYKDLFDPVDNVDEKGRFYPFFTLTSFFRA